MVKVNPAIPDKEHIDAKIVINTQLGPKTDIPVVCLMTAEDYGSDIHDLAASLVFGMEQYPAPENVRAVSVITCGDPHYPGIKWLEA